MARKDSKTLAKLGDVGSRPCTIEKSLRDNAIDAPHVAFADGNFATRTDLIFRWVIRTRTRRLAWLSGRGGCLLLVLVLVLVAGDAG